MKVTWLEDFLALVDTGTFSRAASLRNVTQPAFSRRIQMFEDWLGVELVNRRAHRLELTDTAARFEPALRGLVNEVYEVRSRMRADAVAEHRVGLTTQHTLMVSHLPRLLRQLRDRHEGTAFRVRTGNLEDCILQLSRGEADMLMCFELEGEPLSGYTAGKMERIPVGMEQLIPVAARDPSGRPSFDPVESRTIRLLSYPEESFLGRVVRNQCLAELVRDHTVETVCESAFTMGIKEMTLSGLGIAWLPYHLIEREIQDGSLVALHESLHTPRLNICLYASTGEHDPRFDDMWAALKAESPAL
ncbi:HTH-type transcriptional regulator YjiE [wastewater metagenome]|uniref:HTH-type transcriptional regulator YjiE n=2 Tax=unclassified sequences TaxID=12908 RepID=A0A5B8RFN0_9ZZZZ|nr:MULTISPECIES: LysR substrate-binding domain-containing protein [Arhodomonas]MCS4504455.1 LysR substrate-binding domain-containing protein [Arhodomonas aquaeolei]QEA06648.1 HTH-type transcriptional regulator YjiE [uncultured organism]